MELERSYLFYGHVKTCHVMPACSYQVNLSTPPAILLYKTLNIFAHLNRKVFHLPKGAQPIEHEHGFDASARFGKHPTKCITVRIDKRIKDSFCLLCPTTLFSNSLFDKYFTVWIVAEVCMNYLIIRNFPTKHSKVGPLHIFFLNPFLPVTGCSFVLCKSTTPLVSRSNRLAK